MPKPKSTSGFEERLRLVAEGVGGIAQMARLAGVTEQAVYGWFNGAKPYPRTITKLCLALGVRQPWLLHGEGPERIDRDEEAPSLREVPPQQLDDAALTNELADLLLGYAELPPSYTHMALDAIRARFTEWSRRAQMRIDARPTLQIKRNGK